VSTKGLCLQKQRFLPTWIDPTDNLEFNAGIIDPEGTNGDPKPNSSTCPGVTYGAQCELYVMDHLQKTSFITAPFTLTETKTLPGWVIQIIRNLP